MVQIETSKIYIDGDPEDRADITVRELNKLLDVVWNQGYNFGYNQCSNEFYSIYIPKMREREVELYEVNECNG